MISKSYLKMITEFPLKSIRNTDDLTQAEKRLDELLRLDLDQGESEYLEALSDLIECYEHNTYPIPDASEADVLGMLMESNGFNQSTLALKLNIAQSTISEVLSGKRRLTKKQIIKISKAFNVGPQAFFPSYK